MAQDSFEIDTFIEVPPEKVKSFLSTLSNHTQIHPLIVNIAYEKTTKAADGSRIDHYKIRDRMKQGPFMTTFTYSVEMSINARGEIVYDAHQSPGIYLHNVTICLPEGNGTRIQERVEITAPSLLIKTVYKQGLASHKEMFAKLKAILEGSPIPSK
ncbi:hypothetical protein KSC_041380 [Ktedonobacter sp. SOSP1-52]|uniref:SRPBCC family protein n=1 Tax=Ktedonobacter sp. SOSP1-52 TaxID=2778366 RepID=UPI00191594AE|nr:SRPBCC family protein [Ktedonobacter sp. SOSP1-52]GHO65246.1 hypothetical protein KSC_041380 [Ktedonobacter sp. SOSP1-52]